MHHHPVREMMCQSKGAGSVRVFHAQSSAVQPQHGLPALAVTVCAQLGLVSHLSNIW